MKNSSIIVNISRGSIICENDLIEALKNNEISYVGLDVFEMEPIRKDNPLISMVNVILIPHSAFYGLEAIKICHIIVSELIRHYINNRAVKEI